VLPAGRQRPHIEIIPAAASSASYTLDSAAADDSYRFPTYLSPTPLPGHGPVQLILGTKSAERGAFPFWVKVIGRPDDRSGRPFDGMVGSPDPTWDWAVGWFRVKAPE
jgi:hypothetical protein